MTVPMSGESDSPVRPSTTPEWRARYGPFYSRAQLRDAGYYQHHRDDIDLAITEGRVR